MRPSLKKTPAAVLRAMIGIKDLEMAELLHCSPALIHSIETGRKKLTDEKAMKMFHETQICPKWLLKGDPNVPAVSASGEPSTRHHFQRAQADNTFLHQPHKYLK